MSKVIEEKDEEIRKRDCSIKQFKEEKEMIKKKKEEEEAKLPPPRQIFHGINDFAVYIVGFIALFIMFKAFESLKEISFGVNKY